MNFALQKAVELGVQTIIPLFSERINYNLSDFSFYNKIKHWNCIIIDACRQSKRSSLPFLCYPVHLYKWIKYLFYMKNFVNITNIVFSLDAISNFRYLKSSKYINVVIGSEGGFSLKELFFFKNNNFVKIFLGPRILRTETAVLSGITALQIFFGDM